MSPALNSVANHIFGDRILNSFLCNRLERYKSGLYVVGDKLTPQAVSQNSSERNRVRWKSRVEIPVSEKLGYVGEFLRNSRTGVRSRVDIGGSEEVGEWIVQVSEKPGYA